MNEMVELLNTQSLINSLKKIKEDVNPIEVIEHHVNIKLYQNTGLTFDERVNGLNHAAKLRTSVFHSNKDNPDNKELTGFIEYLRLNDEQIINIILYLAGIKNNHHQLYFDELNKEDKQSIINAINQIKALASLLPKHIAMPI